VLAACLVVSTRRKDDQLVAAVLTAFVVLGGALVTAMILPTSAFGIAPHQLRWLWPISLFTFFVVAVTIARRTPSPVSSWRACGAFGLVVVVLAGWNLPYYNSQAGPAANEFAIAPLRELDAQLGALSRYKTVLFDVKTLRFAEPYSTSIISELDRRGIEVKVDDPSMARQLGPARRFTGTADGRVFLREGRAALEDVPGAQRVAFVYGLSPDELRERDDLRAQLLPYIQANGVPLTEAGRADVGRLIPKDVSEFLDGDQMYQLEQDGYLAADPAWRARFARYAELQHRFDWATEGVYFTTDLNGG
jgi:hypothetical protein